METCQGPRGCPTRNKVILSNCRLGISAFACQLLGDTKTLGGKFKITYRRSEKMLHLHWLTDITITTYEEKKFHLRVGYAGINLCLCEIAVPSGVHSCKITF